MTGAEAASKDDDLDHVLEEGAAADAREPEADGKGPSDATSAFALENAKRRSSVKDFCKSSPHSRLCVLQEVLSPLQSLMVAFLTLSSSAWEQKEAAKACIGKMRSYVILEASKGAQVEDCMRLLLTIFHKPAVGFLNLHVHCKYRVQRFCATAAGMASLHCLLRHRRRGLPYTLFKLLDRQANTASVAEELLKIPSCLHDELTDMFLTEFPTKDSLVSKTALSMLECMATMLAVDVAEIESTHSTTREFASLRSKGWTASLESVSARFVHQQCRKADSCTHTRATDAASRANPEAHAGAKAAASGKVKQRRGGGGPWRAFLSARGRGNQFSKTSIADLKQSYAQLREEGGEAWQHLLDAGRAGTLAHREGHHAFGPRRRTDRQTQLQLQQLQSQHDNDVIALPDIERDNFALVELAGVSFGERLERFKEHLQQTETERQSADSFAILSKAEAAGLREKSQDVESLPLAAFWQSTGHTALIKELQGYPASASSAPSAPGQAIFPQGKCFRWKAPGDKAAKAGAYPCPALCSGVMIWRFNQLCSIAALVAGQGFLILHVTLCTCQQSSVQGLLRVGRGLIYFVWDQDWIVWVRMVGFPI